MVGFGRFEWGITHLATHMRERSRGRVNFGHHAPKSRAKPKQLASNSQVHLTAKVARPNSACLFTRESLGWRRNEELSCHEGPTDRGGVCAERRSTRTGIQTSTSILGPSDVGPTVRKIKHYYYSSILSLSLSLSLVSTERKGMPLPAQHVHGNGVINFPFL